MNWKQLRRSGNVEDRRGSGRPRGGGPVMMKGGCGTIVLALICLFVFKIDPSFLLGGMTSTPPPAVSRAKPSAAENEVYDFTTAIKGSLDDVWTRLFQEYGKQYRPARLVSYDGSTRMGTGGVADSRMGPFYLPAEGSIYLDDNFFLKMQREMRAGGDFAYAYVIAHEEAHHVQHLLGTTDQVFKARQRLSEREANRLTVRLELQADFLAGVWAHYADKDMQKAKGVSLLQEGDIEEAIRAARAVGDDTIQRQATGRVVEDSFTHGTSEQRLRWFMKGFKTGDLSQMDTFQIPYSKL